MAEPVTLYKGEEEFTTHAPSEAKRLEGEGWSLSRPDPSTEGRGEAKAEKKPAKPAPVKRRRKSTPSAGKE
jgi:hypothetical protein